MKRFSLAVTAALIPIAAHAQFAPPAAPGVKSAFEPILVTASRGLQPEATLRDAVVITREEIEDSGALSLAEVLQRRAGLELSANGGPGQPQALFIRGAGSANTLVLIDGVRVNTATQGTASLEAIPLDMIERVEVVKGPLSSLYGSEAAGGVIQVFTRGNVLPYFFASAAAGTDRDLRASTGLTTVDRDMSVSLSMGARKVDARSATNDRNTFSYDPDRDPYENAFANLRMSQKYWQGETITLEVFGSRSRTHYDIGVPPPGVTDRTDQTLAGWRFSSSNEFMKGWKSRMSVGESLDDLRYGGQYTDHYRTRQDQGTWINEFGAGSPTSAIVGLEYLRQVVSPDSASDGTTIYATNSRTTKSEFASLSQASNGQKVDASVRHDDDDQFGGRNTGSVSYGMDLPGWFQLAATFARGYRAPTFNDLYLTLPGYTPNPNLKPEESKSREISLRSLPTSSFKWRVTAFDNRFSDLIVFVNPSPANVASARIKGLEATIEATWWGTTLRASATAQRPEDDETGARLSRRATRFGSVDISRAWGRWTGGLAMLASGDRFDSTNEAPGSRLGGYAVFDARVRYAITPKWTAELVATNLLDKRYENALGYDATRRGVLLNLRFASY